MEGAKRCFAYLKTLGLTVGVFVSDRHRGIAKWIRENCATTKHYFDIWHIARSVTKKLLVLSKEKGCGIIKDWMKGIRRHIFWCATSTTAGFESLITAKWNSFLRHVCNKHENHPDRLYPKCHHGVLEPRKWIKVGKEIFPTVRIKSNIFLLAIEYIDTPSQQMVMSHESQFNMSVGNHDSCIQNVKMTSTKARNYSSLMKKLMSGPIKIDCFHLGQIKLTDKIHCRLTLCTASMKHGEHVWCKFCVCFISRTCRL